MEEFSYGSRVRVADEQSIYYGMEGTLTGRLKRQVRVAFQFSTPWFKPSQIEIIED